MRPAILLPGDVILYKNHGALGSLISWGAWKGKPQEALEYSHIGVVYDGARSFEMNPPAARLFLLDEVPWDRVDVWRFNVNGINPFADHAPTIEAFQAACRKRVGQRYAYGTIAGFLGLRVLGFMLPGASRWLLSKGNPMPQGHRDICSTCAEEVIEEGAWVKFPGLDLIPSTGKDQAMPSDFPTSPYFHKVTG